MNTAFVRSIVTGAVLGLLATSLAAQTPAVSRNDASAVSATPAVALYAPTMATSPSRTAPPAPAEQKDPTIAGVASFLIPGLGSFYAGNTTHGVVHLGIHVGSYALMLGGATSCDVYSGCSNNAALIGIGALALIGNDIWSIFTAVNDAHAFNGDQSGRSGRVVGSLYVAPDMRPLGVEQKGMTRSTGVQLLSLRF